MAKSVKRAPAKKKAAKKTPAKKVAKKQTEKPEMNFMAKLLKQREEQRKLHEQDHNSNVIQLHANSRSGYVINNGFARFHGPRRKAA